MHVNMKGNRDVKCLKEDEEMMEACPLLGVEMTVWKAVIKAGVPKGENTNSRC